MNIKINRTESHSFSPLFIPTKSIFCWAPFFMFYVISSLSRNLWYCLLSKEIVVIIIQAKFEILPYTPQKSYFVGTPCTLRFAQNDMNNVIRCIYFVIPSVVEGSPIKLVEKDKNDNSIVISHYVLSFRACREISN